MTDQQLRRQALEATWLVRQYERVAPLRPNKTGRPPRQPRSLDELPPPPTDDELARWQATQK